jgi:hypothetical protein
LTVLAANIRTAWFLSPLTIMAWNRHRKHETLTKLQLPSIITDENFPRPI